MTNQARGETIHSIRQNREAAIDAKAQLALPIVTAQLSFLHLIFNNSEFNPLDSSNNFRTDLQELHEAVGRTGLRGDPTHDRDEEIEIVEANMRHGSKNPAIESVYMHYGMSYPFKQPAHFLRIPYTQLKAGYANDAWWRIDAPVTEQLTDVESLTRQVVTAGYPDLGLPVSIEDEDAISALQATLLRCYNYWADK